MTPTSLFEITKGFYSFEDRLEMNNAKLDTKIFTVKGRLIDRIDIPITSVTQLMEISSRCMGSYNVNQIILLYDKKLKTKVAYDEGKLEFALDLLYLVNFTYRQRYLPNSIGYNNIKYLKDERKLQNISGELSNNPYEIPAIQYSDYFQTHEDAVEALDFINKYYDVVNLPPEISKLDGEEPNYFLKADIIENLNKLTLRKRLYLDKHVPLCLEIASLIDAETAFVQDEIGRSTSYYNSYTKQTPHITAAIKADVTQIVNKLLVKPNTTNADQMAHKLRQLFHLK